MELSTVDILKLIATADWRDFDAGDYASFAGVCADAPMIAEDDELETIYILHGQQLSIIGPSGNEYQYVLAQTNFYDAVNVIPE